MKKHAEAAIKLTKALLEEGESRSPGSKQSRDCADALAEKAETFADSVKTEDFTLSPKAFFAWIRILVATYVVTLGFMWLGWYLPASVLLIGAVAIMVFQFFMYKETIDPFFPKDQGRNVMASVEPEGVVKGELIISGHHDSAPIFNFLVHQPKLYALRVNGGIGSVIALTVVSIILSVFQLSGLSTAWAWIPAVIFTALLILILQLWFFRSKYDSPGAGDNLASTATAWEFLKSCSEAKNKGKGFQHLRITAASWDAEEAGLRGSRAWRRKREKDPLTIPTWNLNLECLYDIKDLVLMTSDINGSVQLSKPLAERCARIASEQTGQKVSTHPIAFLTGGTDAGETARAGVEATTLMGMPWANDEHASVYHTPMDTIDAVSLEAVAAALNLAESLAKELDEDLKQTIG